jgi:MFS family permease
MNETSAPVNSTSSLLLRTVVLALISASVGWLAAGKAQLGLWPGLVIASAAFGIGLYAMTQLEGVPKGLWITFTLKILSVTGYKIVAVVLVSYLMKDCGATDQQAQWIFLSWGLVMSTCTVLSGALTDALGLRRTLFAGACLCVCARLILIGVSNPIVALICGLVPLAMGEALLTPVLVAATRKFTSPSQRSVAFSVFYALLNLGFMAGYFLYDAVQKQVPVGSTMLMLGGSEFSPRRVLFALSALLEFLILPVLLLLQERSTSASGESEPPPLAPRAAIRETGRLFGLLIHHPGFRRLLVFLAFIGLLKIVFSIMDGVLPTFVERELGPDGSSRTGRFNAVNSIIILIFAPVVGILTRKLPAYRMVIIGGFITASSFVFLALPQSMFQGLANGLFGDWVVRGYLDLAGNTNPYFLTIVLWQIGFSIGEAFYSPRVYEYAVSIAPKGQEASYAALSAVPLLMGKITTGAVFSWLLTRYCPVSGPRDSGTMWTIVGSLVMVSPLALLCLRRFIQMPEEGKAV